MIKVDYKKYKKFCEESLIKCGVKPEIADPVADCAILTDMLGIYSHGTVNLFKYIKKMRAGGLDGNAIPSIIEEGKTWARLKANSTFGMYAGRYAMDVAMEKAREYGMSVVTINDSGHCGACSCYSVYAAQKGFLAFSMSNTVKLMCVPGGKGNIIGNSPISYAVPRGDGKHPLFMDIALSAAAKLKVVKLQKEGKPVPDGWVVDKNGNPTNYPVGNEYSMCPMAAHKGYCLSFLVETLTTVLSGGSFDIKSWLFAPPEVKSNLAHTMIVIDVNNMMDKNLFAERIQEYTDSIINSDKADGSDKIFYPGEPNWIMYDKSANEGLELPDETEEAARTLSGMSGVSLHDCVI